MVALVEGFSTDPSGASSACAVASRIRGKHTGVSVYPDVVCYLTLHGETQHANPFPTLFGKRGGIKCHISRTALGKAVSIRIPTFGDHTSEILRRPRPLPYLNLNSKLTDFDGHHKIKSIDFAGVLHSKLPPRSTAGQLTLDQHIGVRIPGGQP